MPFIKYTCVFYFIFIGSQALSGFQGFGAGSGSILMDDVQCSGTESRLVDCTHTSRHDCEHSEDASVRCLTLRKF